MRVRIQNIGLVKDAEVNVRDLTVVMGPNSSGKSTIAMVVYAALSAAPFGDRMRSPGRYVSFRTTRGFLDSLSDDQRTRLSAAIRAGAVGRDREVNLGAIPPDLLRACARWLLKDFGQSLALEMKRAVGDELSSLQRRANGRRQRNSHIQVDNESLGWSVDLKVTAVGRSVVVSVADLKLPESDDGPEGLFAAPLFSEDLDDEILLDSIVSDWIAPRVAAWLFSGFPRGVHYLPAARSGLLQSHRIVAAAMVQRAASAGIREMSVPALNGVVADFISSVIEPDRLRRPRRGRFAEFSRRIEQELLKGRVTRDDSLGYPEIEFADESGTYPMQRASSMVTELTPIVLLLKGAVGEDDLVIIEEPESHLHPESQALLASVLFDLAGRVPVLLTTHSDYVVSTVNNRLRAEQLQSKSGTQVSALQMHRNNDGSATATKLDVDRMDGISEENFTEVAGRLYDEQVEQQIALAGGY